MLQRMMLIALAGAFGTLARHGLGGIVQRYAPESHLPVGTVVVNVVGCFLFSVVWSLAHERLLIEDDT